MSFPNAILLVNVGFPQIECASLTVSRLQNIRAVDIRIIASNKLCMRERTSEDCSIASLVILQQVQVSVYFFSQSFVK